MPRRRRVVLPRSSLPRRDFDARLKFMRHGPGYNVELLARGVFRSDAAYRAFIAEQRAAGCRWITDE